MSALLVGLPWLARHRMPDQVATHWSGSHPDDSMTLTAAALFPAGVWLLVVLGAAVAHRFPGGRASGVPGTLLASGGVLLTGAQASIVHSNLDRSRWQDAAPVDVWVVAIVVGAAVAGLLAWFATRRPGTAAGSQPRGPVMTIPAGEQLIWLSRTSNPWLQLLAAVLGTGAAGTALPAATGLTGLNWPLLVPLALMAPAVLACSSVQARVTATGLDIGFGPFGWPKRHWSPTDIESARAEDRTPAQAGGWGYRVNGLGTTVMLRRGACLVVRTHQGAEFAVSVDDAERGAALLNSLTAKASETPTT
ncbi:DUF1648 domain-containing protein [Streptomyces kaniharaensis]|uniref:DUF1648 domain-containing protein n=1 Tax=Streptomyces kaniharaensis TaxID=212423 RepID=UPI002DDC948E|nr:DUF1648 domain-containing protein [Streptomyces kaniharaensis]